MSTHIFMHASSNPGIKAAPPPPGDGYGGPLRISIFTGDDVMPDHVTIYTGSIALADALAAAINDTVAKFAKEEAAQ
jgi:hypothetical protein